MAHYIDKDALVAELKKRIRDYWSDSENTMGIYPYALEEVIKYVGTLEVKEVDFETAAHGRIDYPLIGHDFPNIYPNYKELKDYCDKNGIKDEDKIKIIIIKDDNTMTRKEEIIQTARQKEKEVGFSQFVKDANGVNSSYGIGFLEGAEWADEHPIKEPVSEDLLEAAKRYCVGSSFFDAYMEKPAFKAGANWQKEQMMKDAITAIILPANLEETEFCLDDYDEVKHITRLVKEENLKIGDKVKVIVIKDEQL